MATETGSMSQLLDQLTRANDPQKILEPSKEIKEGARLVQIRLGDRDSDYYPFVFKKGDIVERLVNDTPDPESRGEILDGLYEGRLNPVDGTR